MDRFQQKWMLREAGYPVLRLEEMYGYPEALSEVQLRGYQAPSGSTDVPRGDDNGGDTAREGDDNGGDAAREGYDNGGDTAREGNKRKK